MGRHQLLLPQVRKQREINTAAQLASFRLWDPSPCMMTLTFRASSFLGSFWLGTHSGSKPCSRLTLTEATPWDPEGSPSRCSGFLFTYLCPWWWVTPRSLHWGISTQVNSLCNSHSSILEQRFPSCGLWPPRGHLSDILHARYLHYDS